jgi:hypothetical protein
MTNAMNAIANQVIPQLGQVRAECGLAVLRRHVQRLPGIQEEV